MRFPNLNLKSMYAYMKIKFIYQFTGEDNQISEEKYFTHLFSPSAHFYLFMSLDSLLIYSIQIQWPQGCVGKKNSVRKSFHIFYSSTRQLKLNKLLRLKLSPKVLRITLFNFHIEMAPPPIEPGL